MKKQLAILFSAVVYIVGIYSVVPEFAHAVSLRDQVGVQLRAVPGVDEGYQAQDPRAVAAGIIQTFMLFLGSVFVVLICISGYWLLSARGEADKVQKAKDTMRRAVIGFFLCLSAYSISAFVLSQLQKTILEEQQVNNSNGDCFDLLGCN